MENKEHRFIYFPSDFFFIILYSVIYLYAYCSLFRSWLVSEGLITSEGDLLDSSGVEGEWGSLQIPSSSPQTSSPNPDSLSSLKNSSPSNPAASSTSKKVTLPSPMSSSTQPQPSSSGKIPDPLPSTQSSSSTLPSPTKTTQTPVSPSKFSSPHRRRQRAHAAACLTKVTLDTPPSAPRQTAYQHPYHPEPWTPESPILLLLSRFSHTTDPSAALVSSGVMSGLLYYLTQHQDPSSRCLRMLCRLSCNPNCLQALVRTGSVALICHHLCQREGGSGGEERQTDRVKAKVKQLGKIEVLVGSVICNTLTIEWLRSIISPINLLAVFLFFFYIIQEQFVIVC